MQSTDTIVISNNRKPDNDKPKRKRKNKKVDKCNQDQRIKITHTDNNNNRRSKLNNKNANKYNGVIKQLPGRIADNYRNSVLYPEAKLSARIPSLFPLPTIMHSAKYLVSYQVGSTTNYSWFFRPFYLGDSVNGDSSTFLYNANSTLDGTTLTGYSVGKMSAQLPEKIASAYRLVSASVTTAARTKLMDLSGRIAQAIHTDANSQNPIPNNTAGTFSISSSEAEFNSASVTENSMHCVSQVITPGVSLRSIYLPFDPTFYQFQPLNRTRSNPVANDDFFFVGYGTGLTAGTVIEHTINLNFELEPHGTAFSLSLAKRCEEVKSADKSMESIHASVANASSVAKDGMPPSLGIDFGSIAQGIRDVNQYMNDLSLGGHNGNKSDLLRKIRQKF